MNIWKIKEMLTNHVVRLNNWALYFEMDKYWEKIETIHSILNWAGENIFGENSKLV